MYVPGDVSLQPQAEYILFLEPQPQSSNFRMVGLTQGVYHVYQDASTQRHGHPAASHILVQNTVIGDGNPSGTVPLQGFHKFVAQLVSAGVQDTPHGLKMNVTVASAESREPAACTSTG